MRTHEKYKRLPSKQAVLGSNPSAITTNQQEVENKAS